MTRVGILSALVALLIYASFVVSRCASPGLDRAEAAVEGL